MKSSESRRGIALVIVLGFLVILSSLAIAFFSSVTTELKASRNYSSTVTTRQLADTAVNIVMGQIREATNLTWNSQAHSWGAWASQPGMIRVFGTGGAPSSAPYAYYKLYSAKQMVVTTSSTPATITSFDPENPATTYGGSAAFGTSGDLASDWDKYPAIFTDLNSPVMVTDPLTPGATAAPVFPIVDPRATIPTAGTALAGSLSGDKRWGLAEGFSYTTAVDGAINAASSSGATLGTAALGDNTDRLPMPGRWIYMLQDGSLTVPDASGTTGATWANANLAPSASNPIVGRIAFWTDDETSKININTAAGFAIEDPTQASGYSNGYTQFGYAGSFWDTPRFNTLFDIGNVNTTSGALMNATGGGGGLAACQPAQFEYQRYPGHPMTTSLGAVFSSVLGSEQLYLLTPRTSQTVYTAVNGSPIPDTSMGGTQRLERALAPSITPKTERLYASLDEMLFAETYSGTQGRQTTDTHLNTWPGTYSGAPAGTVPNLSQNASHPVPYTVGAAANTGVINPALLEKMKFFLTPSSRAPDLNLFGTPRITIWPVANAISGQNPFDVAIAYDSTVGGSTGKQFIFQRNAPTNSGLGALVQNMDILDAGNNYNGNGKTTNVALLTYLRNLGSLPIPGFGNGTFATKYPQPAAATNTTGTNWDGILGEIFDYIRTANLADTTGTGGVTSGMYPFQYASAGHVCPSRADVFNTGTAIGGFGRTSTIQEATLVFYVSGWTSDPVPVVGYGGTPFTAAYSPTMSATATQKWPGTGMIGGTAYNGKNGASTMGSLPFSSLYGPYDQNTADFVGNNWGSLVRQDQYPNNSTANGLGAYRAAITGAKGPTASGITAYFVRAFLLLPTVDVMQGYAPKQPAYRANGIVAAPHWDLNYNLTSTSPTGASQYLLSAEKLFVEVQGLDQLAINSTVPALPTTQNTTVSSIIGTYPLRFPTDAKSIIHYFSGNTWSGRDFGGYEGFSHTLGWHWGFNYNTAQGTYPFTTPSNNQPYGLSGTTANGISIPAMYQANFYTLQSGAGASGTSFVPNFTQGGGAVPTGAAVGNNITGPETPDGNDTSDSTAAWQGAIVSPLPNATFNFLGNDKANAWNNNPHPIVVRLFFGVPTSTSNAFPDFATNSTSTLTVNTTYPNKTPSWSVNGITATAGAIPLPTNPNGVTQLLQTFYLTFPSDVAGAAVPGGTTQKGWPVPTRNYRVDDGGFVQATGTTQKQFNTGGRVESAQTLLDSWTYSQPSGPPGTQTSSIYFYPSTTDVNNGATYIYTPTSKNAYIGPKVTVPGRIGWSFYDSSEPDIAITPNIYASNRFLQIIQPGDVLRSVIFGTYNNPGGQLSWPVTDGDLRTLSLQGGDYRYLPTAQGGTLTGVNVGSPIPTTAFKPHPDYFSPAYHFACALRYADGTTPAALASSQPSGATPPALINAYVYNGGMTVNIDNPTVGATPATGNFGEIISYATNIATAGTSTVPNFTKCPIYPQTQALFPVTFGDGTTQGANMQGFGRQDLLAGASAAGGYPSIGDVDTGIGTYADGPWAGKPDEGNVIFKYFNYATQQYVFPVAYDNTYQYEPPGDIFFSPNRQMPSPGLFGSLLSHPCDPAGVGTTAAGTAARMYETLAFCPNTCGNLHPGNTNLPKDHLIMDLFNMPFVDPYLISEPLSTAGRVNLNYQIAPFSHIYRSTALRAALASLRVTAVYDKLVQAGTNGNFNYKAGGMDSNAPDNPRWLLNRDETIAAFDSFFGHYQSNGHSSGFFRAASQICERFLYPMQAGVTYAFAAPTFDPNPNYEAGSTKTGEATMTAFWWGPPSNYNAGLGHYLTGDNCREKPYSDLYPRVTTKSNTYTVHVRVQTLRQTVAPNPDGSYPAWQEGRDQVLGEYRGAITIERYIDPNDPRIGQHLYGGALSLTPTIGDSLEPYYRFRVVNTKKFAPQ